MENTCDLKLVKQCMEGSSSAFEQLLNKYKLPIFNLIYRMVNNSADAEDISQETFVKAFKNLTKYDSKYPFLTWLFRIAHNTTIDFLRKKKNIIVSIDDRENPIHIADNAISPDRQTEINFDKQMLYDTLKDINPIYSEILMLRHKQQLDYETIANVLNIPQGTVKIRLFRARRELKTKLSKQNYVLNNGEQNELRKNSNKITRIARQ